MEQLQIEFAEALIYLNIALKSISGDPIIRQVTIAYWTRIAQNLKKELENF